MNLKFTATLDSKSLDKLIKDLTYYKNVVLPKRCEAFVEELAKRGREIAYTQILDFPAVFSGDILSNLSYRKEKSTKDVFRFVVQCDSEHAIYVEMGTGVVGAGFDSPARPYPNSFAPYPGNLPAVYAQGSHMFYTKDGQYGWIYRSDADGTYHFTTGMPSRPFMYNTANQLAEEVISIAKQIFWR